MNTPETDQDKLPASRRISMSMVLEEFLAFFSLERGALHTTYRLLVSPGKSILSYLEGEEGARKRLTNPLRYLVMSTAIVTIAYVYFMPKDTFTAQIELGQGKGREMAGGPKYTNEDEGEEERDIVAAKTKQVGQLLLDIEEQSDDRTIRLNAREAKELMEETTASRVGGIVMGWMNVFLLGALPLNSVLTFVAFRRSGFNLAEHCVTNAFILGFQNIAYVCFLAPGYFGALGILSALYMLLSFTFQFIVWRQVFGIRSVLGNTWGFLVLLVSVFSYITLQGVATFTILWVATMG